MVKLVQKLKFWSKGFRPTSVALIFLRHSNHISVSQWFASIFMLKSSYESIRVKSAYSLAIKVAVTLASQSLQRVWVWRYLDSKPLPPTRTARIDLRTRLRYSTYLLLVLLPVSRAAISASWSMGFELSERQHDGVFLAQKHSLVDRMLTHFLVKHF